MKNANIIKILIAFIIGFFTYPLIYCLFKSPSSVVVLGTIIAIIGWSIKDNLDRQHNLKKLLLFLNVKKFKIPKREKDQIPSYLIRIDNPSLREYFKHQFFGEGINKLYSQNNIQDQDLNHLCEKELSKLSVYSYSIIFLFIFGLLIGFLSFPYILSIFECSKPCFFN